MDNKTTLSSAAKREEKPAEARYFEMSMRGTYPDLKDVKLYTDRVELSVGNAVSFDNEYEKVTSMSYFLGSLLSSILFTSVKELKSKGVLLDEIEGLIRAKLTNPLRMIPVRGYDDPADIEEIQVKLFYYGDGDPETMNEMIRKAQEANPIYRLVADARPIELLIEWVL